MPNLTFDYYPIKPNNYSMCNFKSFFSDCIIENINKTDSKNELRTGFLKLNSNNLVSPYDPSDTPKTTNCVGIWMANVPNMGDESMFKRNPYVWAACARFILAKDHFKNAFSPSSDKNTFLLCHFNQDKMSENLQYHEFKIVQNNQNQSKTNGHNVWVITESEKILQCSGDYTVPKLVKKPTIFKKPIDSSDKCNVYTLTKYLSKYEFGLESSQKSKASLTRKQAQRTSFIGKF